MSTIRWRERKGGQFTSAAQLTLHRKQLLAPVQRWRKEWVIVSSSTPSTSTSAPTTGTGSARAARKHPYKVYKWVKCETDDREEEEDLDAAAAAAAAGIGTEILETPTPGNEMVNTPAAGTGVGTGLATGMTSIVQTPASFPISGTETPIVAGPPASQVGSAHHGLHPLAQEVTLPPSEGPVNDSAGPSIPTSGAITPQPTTDAGVTLSAAAAVAAASPTPAAVNIGAISVGLDGDPTEASAPISLPPDAAQIAPVPGIDGAAITLEVPPTLTEPTIEGAMGADKVDETVLREDEPEAKMHSMEVDGSAMPGAETEHQPSAEAVP